MRYHYPRRKKVTLEGEMDVLRITLHSEGLLDQLKSKEGLNTLISFASHKLVEIAFTPLPQGCESIHNLDKLMPIQYKEQPGLPTENHFVAVLESTEAITEAMAGNPFDAKVVASVWGHQEGTPENRSVQGALKAISAHEALGRDVFITELDDVIERREWIEDRFNVWIVSTSEALDYLNSYLISKNDYTVLLKRPLQYKADALSYYWQRLCELVPSFPPAWSTAVHGEAVLPNGTDLKNHMASFYRRVLDMMESKDKIAIEFYKPGDNLTNEAMLHHLNYFMMLVTGTFDSLAWICNYLYNIYPPPIKKEDRRKVGFRPDDATGQMPSFVTKVEEHNAALAQFLRDHRALLAAFYPARDSIQHRHIIQGRVLIPANRLGIGTVRGKMVQFEVQKAFALAELDQDAANAIRKVDGKDDSDLFTKWGLLDNGGSDVLLEPCKFVKTALRNLLDFYTGFFSLLDFAASSHLTEAILELVSRTESKRRTKPNFTVPFFIDMSSAPVPIAAGSSTRVVRATTAPVVDRESIALYGIYTAVVHLE